MVSRRRCDVCGRPTYAARRFHLHCVQNLMVIRGTCTDDCAIVVVGVEVVPLVDFGSDILLQCSVTRDGLIVNSQCSGTILARSLDRVAKDVRFDGMVLSCSRSPTNDIASWQRVLQISQSKIQSNPIFVGEWLEAIRTPKVRSARQRKHRPARGQSFTS